MDDEMIEKFSRSFIVDLKTDCWIWKGWIGKRGYANFNYKRKIYSAARFSYWLYYGKKPGKKCVCHTCDNTKCVNPEHLFLGTPKDNTDDMISKNRGSYPPKPRKLNPAKVKKIHKYLAFGMSQIIIAKEFNCSRRQINRISTGKAWVNVPKANPTKELLE